MERYLDQVRREVRVMDPERQRLIEGLFASRPPWREQRNVKVNPLYL